MNIKEQMNLLIELQKMDTESRELETVIKKVSVKLESFDVELQKNIQKIHEHEAAEKDLKKQYREYEADSSANLDRIKTTEAKLRSVKTNKEYQALLKEIEDIKTKSSTIEDEMIECLDKIDVIGENIVKQKDEYQILSDRIEKEKKEIEKDAEHDRHQLDGLRAARKKFEDRIKPELMDKYITINDRYQGGLAVVQVKDAVCLGCNMNIPPQLYNELYRCDSLKFCPNCQRMIYWKE